MSCRRPLSGDAAGLRPVTSIGTGIGILRALCIGLVLALGLGTGTAAQTAPDVAAWDEAIEAGTALLAEPDASTVELELLRDRLLRMRSAAIEQEAAAAPRVADINARLQALGPAPAEGASEPPELAQRRAQIAEELSGAQLPVVEAQDFQRRADAVIRDIDRTVRRRFAAELGSLGPTPLKPGNWIETLQAVIENDGRIRARVRATIADPVARGALLQRVPRDLTLALIGIGIAYSLRLRLVAWAEAMLSRATDPRPIALLVVLRSIAGLLVPAVGFGMLFAALDPAMLLDPAASSRIIALPDFLLAIIGASWLAIMLFAPKLPAYRLVSLDDGDAVSAARMLWGLGLVLAAKLALSRYVADWDMTPAAAATLEFPLFLVGGFLLWRASRVMRTIRHAIERREAAAGAAGRSGSIGLGLLGFGERALWLVALVVPLLAGIGFLAAASYLLYGAILTLGLVGVAVVLYDIAMTMLGAVSVRKGESRRGRLVNEGLLPVVLVALISLAALPLLALIWGARASDIAGLWFQMRDGVTLGGMRISVAVVISFAIVFGLVYGLSRLLQSVLRSTVLPRTSLDAGGRNAVLAGVGYTGFFLAAVAAVSSTGLDLTSLAFVAGALSVGIGFGLQNIVSNFVSGIILLVERPIKEGDWIEVGGFSGYVKGISVRSTEIETFERASVILPNSDLIAGAVLNRTHHGLSGRLQVPVSVAIDSDPRLVERVLLEIVENYPLVLTEPGPVVLLMEIGPDAMIFEVRGWLRDVNFSLSARSDINFDILERFEAEGINLQPFQRDPRPVPPPVAAEVVGAAAELPKTA